MTDFTDTELPLDNTTDTTVEQYDPAHDYHALNAMLNLYDADGRIQFGKDKAAEREYVTGHVATNTKRFESTGERLRYLDTDTALLAESAPGLEEYTSTPALVDAAEALLTSRGYCNAAEQTAGPDSLQYLRGVIATGDRFVAGAEMRERAIEATHADCVEMEGAAIAHIAAKNGIDCLVMRAISDNCDEAYDALCTREFDLEEYAQRASNITLGIVRRVICGNEA